MALGTVDVAAAHEATAHTRASAQALRRGLTCLQHCRREEMAEQGELAEQVVAVLLENGRLRLEQVVAGVAGKMGCEASEVSCWLPAWQHYVVLWLHLLLCMQDQGRSRCQRAVWLPGLPEHSTAASHGAAARPLLPACLCHCTDYNCAVITTAMPACLCCR